MTRVPNPDFEVVVQKAREMKQKSLKGTLPQQSELWNRLLLNELADYLPVGVALLNEQFVLCNYNRLYKDYINKYSGTSPDDALGMCYFNIFPLSRNPLNEVLRSVRDDRRQHTDIEAPLKAPNRLTYWDARAVPVQNNDRRVTGIVICALDVTESVVARQQQQQKDTEIGELKTTIRTLLKLRREDQRRWELKTLANAKESVIPFIGNLRKSLLRADQLNHLDAIEAGINDLVSDFSDHLGLHKYALTPTEMQVAALVKAGKTSKEIAECLCVSPSAIDFHRKGIRKKLELKNTKINLRSFLMEIAKRRS
jgi:DNA-binding CsgD family transcriptional regulator